MNSIENLPSKHEQLIHEWTIEQVESASKPNFGKVFVTAPNLLLAMGDVEVMSGPVGNSDIVDNENFNGKYSVTVRAGQYLKVSRGKLL